MEIVARIVANDLLVPTFGATLAAFVQGIESGELLVKTGISLSVLLRGYALGVFFAFALTSLAVSTRIGRDLLAMLTSMFNPLPSIALLPIALLWFSRHRQPAVRARARGALAARAQHVRASRACRPR